MELNFRVKLDVNGEKIKLEFKKRDIVWSVLNVSFGSSRHRTEFKLCGRCKQM